MKIATPRRYRGTPNQFSDTGVSSTTTSSGTIKIRESVNALGRFTPIASLEAGIVECQERVSPNHSPPTFEIGSPARSLHGYKYSTACYNYRAPPEFFCR